MPRARFHGAQGDIPEHHGDERARRRAGKPLGKLSRRPGRVFLHQLAEHLGKTVAELLEQIGPDELADWRAYFHLKNDLVEQEQRREEMRAGAVEQADKAGQELKRAGYRGSGAPHEDKSTWR